MTRAFAKKFHAGRLNLYRSPAEITEVTRALRHVGRRIALVPTMGALHDGHLSLVRSARRIPGAVVVVSIFVNPLQFGAGEDLDAYPRSLDADLELLGDAGVEAVFAPSPGQIYPAGPRTTVSPGPLGAELEGAARPGHFAGMLTVVAKLLQIVGPDSAFFGEKDYQQLVLIRQLVADLDFGLEVVGVPTRREADGLAMSSRNRYLDPVQREQAVTLSAALLAGKHRAAAGAAAALDAARVVLAGMPALDVDYLVLRSPELSAAPAAGPARLLVAARLGRTRLLDNVAVDLGGTTGLTDHPGVAVPHARRA